MPKLKPGTRRPSVAEDLAITAAALADPDAQPLTEAQWEQAKPLARRGRPLGSGSKMQVTLRLDIDLIQQLKAGGAGWQTRANEALRQWAQQSKA